MSLRLVQSGEAGADSQIVDALKDLLARAETGEVTDLFVVYGTKDERDAIVRSPADLLGTIVFAEEVARSLKCQALGLGDQ
jgi:hypothetical protein